jgi:hypothetical protein
LTARGIALMSLRTPSAIRSKNASDLGSHRMWAVTPEVTT